MGVERLALTALSERDCRRQRHGEENLHRRALYTWTNRYCKRFGDPPAWPIGDRQTGMKTSRRRSVPHSSRRGGRQASIPCRPYASTNPEYACADATRMCDLRATLTLSRHRFQKVWKPSSTFAIGSVDGA